MKVNSVPVLRDLVATRSEVNAARGVRRDVADSAKLSLKSEVGEVNELIATTKVVLFSSST